MFTSMKSALLGLGLAVMAATAAPAATVSFWLSAPILGGPLDGVPLDLLISYEDSALTNGDEVLTPDLGKVTVDPGGLPGFETVDVGYPDFPKLTFANFIPVAFDFYFDITTYPDLAFADILAVWVGGDLSSGNAFLVEETGQTYNGLDVYATYTTVAVAPVPVPASLPLTALGLGTLALLARRRVRR